MAKEKKRKPEDGFEKIESSLTRTEQFIEKNQKTLVIALVAILAVVAVIIVYKKFYIAPKVEKSQNAIIYTYKYLAKDSFNYALNGDGNFPGAEQIIKKYGSTGAGNLAHYYAGVCYMNMKDWDNAIKKFKDFSAGDELLKPIALGCIGDAYTEKQDLGKAADYYQKAADASDNEFTSAVYLMKLGRVYEAQNKFDKALETYKIIKEEYKETQEARTIDKFITRAEMQKK